MPITANVTNEQITASVGETQIDVSVSGGVGPSGAAGSNGQAATVAVGTVTTGAAGSQASVTNVGTSSAAVFDFTIPAGATGPQGPQGATGPAGTTTWAGITDKPTFAAVATSGSASDLGSGTLNASRLPASVVRTNTASAGPIQVYAVTAFPSPPPADPNDYMLFEGYDGVDMTSQISASGVIVCAAITLAGTDLATTLSGKAAVSHAHSAADVTSGTFDIARIPTGTTSTTVSLGNHTHSQLHDRSHSLTSTSDHTAGNWKVIYTDGSGHVQELALGDAGKALVSNGASAAPSWATAGSNSASDLTTGTLAAARIGAHASTHQTGGSDAVTNVVVSPSQITGNQNDYSPGTGDIVRLSSDAARNITGITAGSSGDVRVLVNVGSFTITLVHQSTSSTAANRFLVSFGADYLLAANAAAVIVYDSTISRWRVI